MIIDSILVGRVEFAIESFLDQTLPNSSLLIEFGFHSVNDFIIYFRD